MPRPEITILPPSVSTAPSMLSRTIFTKPYFKEHARFGGYPSFALKATAGEVSKVRQ